MALRHTRSGSGAICPIQLRSGHRWRAQPDRRHEQSESRFHRARWRSQERVQRVHGRGVHAGARLFQLPPRAGGLHPGRQRLGGLRRTAGYIALAQLDKERKLFFSTPFTLGQHRLRQQVQSTPLCLGVSGQRPLRGKPPLDRRWCYVRHPQHSGLLQQPVRHAHPDPAEYAARNARRTSPGCRTPSPRRRRAVRRRSCSSRRPIRDSTRRTRRAARSAIR